MSRTNTNNNKLFCKICFDAKKSEKEYTSHAIKNRDGDVCCPILKATECRYCHKTGHTLAHCELRNKNAAPAPAPVKQAAPKPAPKPVVAPANKFALLDSDNEEDDDDKPIAEQKPVAEEKPSYKPKYERKHTVCERPVNQIFHIIDLSYLAKERERLGQTDPALGKNYAKAAASAVKSKEDNYNRPDAARGDACFYSSEEERRKHREQLIAEHAERIKHPLFASADETW